MLSTELKKPKNPVNIVAVDGGNNKYITQDQV